MFRICLLVSLFFSSQVLALSVITSIKPFQLITWDLMAGIAQPELLLSNNASPHQYSLKPSDIKRIKNADLIIWYGPELEPFLSKPLTQHSSTLTISKIPDLILRKNGHEHEHGMHDPHVWLGPKQVKVIAFSIKTKLKEKDPENAAHYEKNYVQFIQQLNNTVISIEKLLKPTKEQGYYVFHDAYGYFESFFSLNHLGHFTVSPERAPGAKTVMKIRQTIEKQNIRCIFSEPQFSSSVVDSVARNTNIYVSTLDPLGWSIQPEIGSYNQFLFALAKQFSECLQKK